MSSSTLHKNLNSFALENKTAISAITAKVNGPQLTFDKTNLFMNAELDQIKQDISKKI
jgi:hypothetical protein